MRPGCRLGVSLYRVYSTERLLEQRWGLLLGLSDFLHDKVLRAAGVHVAELLVLSPQSGQCERVALEPVARPAQQNAVGDVVDAAV